ncbi:MAG: hypothetical protein QOI50_4328 [Pseudonocardiales bacterium]|nr:hypothetical protein [Pseudonocardiales bacterium]
MRAFDTGFGRVATLICNDAWQPVLPWLAAQDGAELLLVPINCASGFGPDSLNTIDYWGELLRFTARLQQCWVVFCNRVARAVMPEVPDPPRLAQRRVTARCSRPCRTPCSAGVRPASGES